MVEKEIEKKCPKCNGKLEEITSSGVKNWIEDLGYKCRNCGFVLSSKDYNKL